MPHSPLSPFGLEKDLAYMALALEQAQKAFDLGEVPIGALMVNATGEIVGQAHNAVELMHSQTAHAELLALRAAGQKLGDWRMAGCWLYVTLEPCSMCASAILLSRCRGIIYGAPSPVFGYSLDNGLKIQVYKEDSLLQIGGVMEKESSTLLKKFFKLKRK